jgi:diaminohydroxyphosphoribosylaminopyrimidine deaminase/5-amino-6-(5-phosphoribosylamino)uracil reductase
VRAHRPHRSLRRRAARRRRRPRGGRRPRADAAGRGGAARLRAAGVEVELGVAQQAAEEGALGAWLTGVREGTPVRRLEGRRHPRRAGRRRRRQQPLGHRPGRARRRPPAAGHLRRGRRRLGDRAGRRPAADRPRRRRPGRRPSAAARGARPPRPAAAGARVLDGAAPTLVSTAASPRDCSASCSPATCAGCCSRAARRWPPPSCATAWWTRRWCTWRPKLLGAGAPLVGDLGITGIGNALTLTVTGLTHLGGDVQIRLRPTRHTGDRPHADERG